jgi:N-hydroxyarylamine O-acetyltransferase
LRLPDYLERIAYHGEVAPTRNVLEQLLAHHVQSIPFENVDVQLGIRLTTEPADAYRKIVNRQRGGWCYEQNGLFGWALSEVGFEVTRIAAAVMRADRGDIATANHLCLLVQTEDSNTPWLVDVGFGGSMFAPIELRESAHEQRPFRLGLRRTNDDHWQFWEDIGKGEFHFDFHPAPADENALAGKCEFLQTNPESSFVQSLVAQIRLPDSHKTLRGKVFSHATSKGVETSVIASPEELVVVLRDHFRLDVPEVAELWPRIEARHQELFGEEVLSDTYAIRGRLHPGLEDEDVAGKHEQRADND